MQLGDGGINREMGYKVWVRKGGERQSAVLELPSYLFVSLEQCLVLPTPVPLLLSPPFLSFSVSFF